MADSLGRISIPDPVASSATFPLRVTRVSGTKFGSGTDYGYAQTIDRPIITHQYGSVSSKIEQRFQVGLGPRKFTFRKATMTYAERTALISFWESVKGSWSSFLYEAPNVDGRAVGAFTTVRVNFEYAPLSITHLANQCQTGITFVEAFDPASAPAYSITSTVTRFPSTVLSTALLSQVQQIIPLVHIRVRESAVPDNIFISDRRVTVGGQLYLPRLQNVGEPGSDVIVSQNIDGRADDVQFVLGNADRVLTLLSNDTDLRLADISLSLYHVQTGIKLDLWRGFITSFVNDGSPSFSISASDGLYQVMQQYPIRLIDRQCWKTFNDGINCPYSAQSTNHGGDPLSCDFYFNSINGCQVHGMDKFFGAHPTQPQRVAGLAQVVSGLRNAPTSTSIISDTVWGNALKEIYINDRGDPLKSLPVACDIVSGRRETNSKGEPQFYDALGIVGLGPITLFTGTIPHSSPTIDGWYTYTSNADGLFVITGPLLDGFTAHGYGGANTVTGLFQNSGLGLRCVHGNDPEINPFCLTQLVGGDTSQRAAGTAFIELRRVDADQAPSLTESHQMTAQISGGLAGYTWDSGGNRTLIASLTNPFWIVVNCLLRATATFQADSATQLTQFVISSLAASDGSGTAQIANLLVSPLLGTGTEVQFEFQGVIGEQKPLRDWIAEILSCCLGYFTFEYGKLRLGIRSHAVPTDAFTIGNILLQSLRLEPINAQFERLYIDFADKAYQFQNNTASYYDKSHAAYMGRQAAPLTARLKSVGGSSLSQMLRVAMTRTREELGGVTPAEWKSARMASWSTTVLALSTYIGQVVSMTTDDIPGGTGNFRILSWKLKKDWSIDITAKTVTASMYDKDVGPRPTEVLPDPLPAEFFPIPFAPVWAPFEIQANPSDALFPSEWSFLSDQEYIYTAAGTPSAFLSITGKLPETAFISGCPAPAIGSISQSTSGGSITAATDGTYYRVTISAFNATGVPSPSAAILVILVPSGTSTNSITLNGIVWPAVTGLTTYQVFVSDRDDMICAQQSGSLTGGPIYTPTSITITGPFVRSTWALPTPYVSKVRIKAKPSRHNGVAGFGVFSVSTNKIVASDLVDASGSPFIATGRVLSVIGRPIGAVPFASFNITAHNPITGELILDRDPVGIIQRLDACVIRNRADTPNSPPYTSITDSGYRNSLNAYGGLAVDNEKGAVLRVINGLGRGELRKLLSNTDVTLTWDLPLQLDITSVWIIEQDAYIWSADTSDVGNGDHLKSTTVSVPCDNLLQQPVVVCGFTVDINGVESPDGPNSLREDWVFGAQGTRDVTTGDPSTDMLLTDGLVKFHTGPGPITYNMLPMSQLPNRMFIWQKQTSDANTVTIQAAAGDAFDELGSTTIILTANSTGPTGTAVFKVWG